MLKLYFITLLLFVAVITANAQVHKFFLDTNRNITSDSTKARFYTLVKKLQADSAWAGSIYNLRGDILSTGTYKDFQMKIPQGKITFYGYNLKFNTDSSDFILYQYISTTGYYLNGVKSGAWTDYYIDGYKAYKNLYENNKLNGLHEKYDIYGNVLESGNYINDLKEGNWNIFNNDNVLLSTDVYKNNTVIKHFDKVRRPSSKFARAIKVFEEIRAHPDFNFNFNEYLSRMITSHIPNGIDGVVVVKFFVDRKGKISKPLIIRKLNDTVDLAVINAILNCPNWIPSNQNYQTFGQEVSCPITFVNSKPTSVYLHDFKRYDPYY